MAPMSGRCLNCTCTSVPPRKSTPRGTGLPIVFQCQAIETTPATLKMREKARKYHFFPNQSMFTPRKNSTCFCIPELGLRGQGSGLRKPVDCANRFSYACSLSPYPSCSHPNAFLYSLFQLGLRGLLPVPCF